MRRALDLHERSAAEWSDTDKSGEPLWMFLNHDDSRCRER